MEHDCTSSFLISPLDFWVALDTYRQINKISTFERILVNLLMARVAPRPGGARINPTRAPWANLTVQKSIKTARNLPRNHDFKRFGKLKFSECTKLTRDVLACRHFIFPNLQRDLKIQRLIEIFITLEFWVTYIRFYSLPTKIPGAQNDMLFFLRIKI